LLRLARRRRRRQQRRQLAVGRRHRSEPAPEPRPQPAQAGASLRSRRRVRPALRSGAGGDRRAGRPRAVAAPTGRHRVSEADRRDGCLTAGFCRCGRSRPGGVAGSPDRRAPCPSTPTRLRAPCRRSSGRSPGSHPSVLSRSIPGGRRADAVTLTLSDLQKRFGSIQALDGCTFSVERGRMVGFLGPNGAGKTTTMRSIFGLVELDRGETLWNDAPIRPEDRLRFGYMPEERGLYPRMPVGEHVAYLGRQHGMGAGAARTAASDWLARLGLADRAAAKVEELSHGNQQRAQLAAALVHEPDLLVLDEPFAGLDPLAVRTLAGLLRAEAARGAAVLFSSHQLDLVEEICEGVAIVDHGRVVATGNIDELKRRSQRRRITLQLLDAPAGWRPEIRGVELIERRNGDLHLSAGTDVDPHRVLAQAEQTAQVVGFAYGPPTLSELFVELVAT